MGTMGLKHKNAHVDVQDRNLVFNSHALEIVIFDRRGKVLWKKSRTSADEKIVWDGIDSLGQRIDAGAYTCKILYEDHQIYYVPFVLMR